MSGKMPEPAHVNPDSRVASSSHARGLEGRPGPSLVLGIDPEASPHPKEASGHTSPGEAQALAAFRECLQAHEAVLAAPSTRTRVRWLKPNLAFFLRHGSRGIALLEEFVANHRDAYSILLDAKFSEIENSLRGSLAFAFETLGAHGVTLNPFLGERSVRLALEVCARTQGARGRVHVLCRTSESSAGPLAGLQSDWRSLAQCVATEARAVTSGDAALACLGGVVVGAAHRDILLSPELRDAGLSVLAPGLGAQGAAFSIVEECASHGPLEILFPMSRGLFAGGAHAPQRALALLDDALAHFPSTTSSPALGTQTSGDPR